MNITILVILASALTWIAALCMLSYLSTFEKTLAHVFEDESIQSDSE